MVVSFDPDKDRVNVAKHGISLARAVDFAIEAVVADDRYDYGEASPVSAPTARSTESTTALSMSCARDIFGRSACAGRMREK